MRSRHRSLSLGLFLLVGSAAGRAGAAPCDSLPNPVYVQASDTLEPVLKRLAAQLRASAVHPLTLVYQLAGSCTIVDTLYNHAKLTGNFSYVPSASESPSWDPNLASLQCASAPAGATVDLGITELAPSVCTAAAAPADVTLAAGPVQANAFVVPLASEQKAITAEQAYLVFGFGADDQLTPWNDESLMFIRTQTKGILLSMAANIKVPAAQWKGLRYDKSTDVVNAVTTSVAPEKTIGILGTAVADANRSTMRVLAYRTFQQRHAYFPDSTSDARDKRNVRDGHYVLWSQGSLLVPAGHTNGQYVANLIAGTAATPSPDFEPLTSLVSGGVIPACAMTVTRATEGGDLSPKAPEAPCGCFFDSATGTAPASCHACDAGNPCSSGVCRRGFCEAR